MVCDFIRSRFSHSGRRVSIRWVSQVLSLMLVMVFAAGSALAQGQLGKIVGEVSDPTGAMIAGAKVQLLDQESGQTSDTTTTSDGHFVFQALRNGLYKVTVSMQGFVTGVVPGVKVDLGATAEVAVKLTVGGASQEVVVEGGSEVLQTQTSSVENTITGQSLRSLPDTSRNALDWVMQLPGSQQAGASRMATFNGLSHGALNITFDGLNVQDNLLKSSYGGGMFTIINPKIDAVEEVSVSSSAADASSTGQGAVQIKFVTRRGTNDWHGSVYEYYRDSGLDANTYLNNRQGLRRPTNHLNQYGFSVGGPLVKNHLFVFTNWEDFRLPSSIARTNLLLKPAAATGMYTYKPAAGAGANNAYCTYDGTNETCNLLAMAAAQGLPSAIDPTFAAGNALVQGTRPNGAVSSANLFEDQLSWNSPGTQRRYFDTTRIDYDINNKLRWNVIGNWDHFDSSPDALNSQDASFPGFPTVAGQYSRRWSLVSALNYTITPNLNYEFRIGRTSSIVRFFPEATIAGLYPGGYRYYWGNTSSSFGTSLGLTAPDVRPGQVTGSRSLPSNRDTPVLTFAHNFGYVHGKHTINFGTSLDVITHWDKSFNTAGIPFVQFGVTAQDTAGNSAICGPTASASCSGFLPGIVTSGNDLGYARTLYALLTGRISSVSGSINVDEITKQYVPKAPLTQRDRQNELGFYVNDSWRVTPEFTVNGGLRFEYQGAGYNRNNIYSGVTWANLFGQSGVGNLFKPGTLTGPAAPQIDLLTHNLYKPGKILAPNLGFAWQPNLQSGLLKAILGGDKTVIRGGYSISPTREGLNAYLGAAASTPGATQSISGTLSGGQWTPTTIPLISGGVPTNLSVFPTAFSFPTPESLFTFTGNQIDGFDPNLRIGYVQSWQLGIQRELDQNTVLEVRYVGNHGTRLWREVNYNQVNTLENGFQKEIQNAMNNLAINGGKSFGNTNPGAGTVPVPILTAAFTGSTTGSQTNSNFSSSSFTIPISQGQAGSVANTLAGSSTYLCNMVGSSLAACAARGKTTAGPYPSNFFQVNPDMAGGQAWGLTNANWSNYNSLQVELRRRMSHGLQIMGNYVWSHALTDYYSDTSDTSSSFTDLHNLNLNKAPSPFDLRQTARITFMYQLPFGPGQRFNPSNKLASKALEGWEVDNVTGIQSGRNFLLTSGRTTVDQYDSGVALQGMTVSQLQGLMRINKTLGNMPSCDSKGTVYFLDSSLIDPKACSANTNIIGFPTVPGQFGQFVYLTGPHFLKPDITLVKRTKVTERVSTEFHAEFFNAFNITNWMVGSPTGIATAQSITSKQFGQTNQYFQDISNNQDEGPRMIQLVLRITF